MFSFKKWFKGGLPKPDAPTLITNDRLGIDLTTPALPVGTDYLDVFNGMNLRLSNVTPNANVLLTNANGGFGWDQRGVIRFRARDIAGLVSRLSNAYTFITPTTLGTPNTLIVVSNNLNGVVVDAPISPDTNVFLVLYDGNSLLGVISFGVNIRIQDYLSLSASTSYVFNVKFSDAFSSSVASGTLSLTTPAAPSTPSAPTNVSRATDITTYDNPNAFDVYLEWNVDGAGWGGNSLAVASSTGNNSTTGEPVTSGFIRFRRDTAYGTVYSTVVDIL